MKSGAFLLRTASLVLVVAANNFGSDTQKISPAKIDSDLARINYCISQARRIKEHALRIQSDVNRICAAIRKKADNCSGQEQSDFEMKAEIAAALSRLGFEVGAVGKGENGACWAQITNFISKSSHLTLSKPFVSLRLPVKKVGEIIQLPREALLEAGYDIGTAPAPPGSAVISSLRTMNSSQEEIEKHQITEPPPALFPPCPPPSLFDAYGIRPDCAAQVRNSEQVLGQLRGGIDCLEADISELMRQKDWVDERCRKWPQWPLTPDQKELLRLNYSSIKASAGERVEYMKSQVSAMAGFRQAYIDCLQ